MATCKILTRNCHFLTVSCIIIGMNKVAERKLRQYPSAIISEQELASLWGGSAASSYARNKRAVQNGDLIRIKRGLYIINKELVRKLPNSFELAQWIYAPSYISFESALSYHNLIPEAVYTITSATIKRSKIFITPSRHFSYLNLPTPNFFFGVAYISEENVHYLMATPWKALFDFIYYYAKDYHTLSDVEDDLRLDKEELPPINREELTTLENYYQDNRVSKFIHHFN